jgi:cystine transport system substrate-binding protein
VIVSQVGITPKRQQAFDFSYPYTFSNPQLIVRKTEKASYASLNDLRGKKLGVGQGSVFEQQARAVPGIEVKSYPAASETLQDFRPLPLYIAAATLVPEPGIRKPAAAR